MLNFLHEPKRTKTSLSSQEIFLTSFQPGVLPKLFNRLQISACSGYSFPPTKAERGRKLSVCKTIDFTIQFKNFKGYVEDNLKESVRRKRFGVFGLIRWRQVNV
jgi:hypothetical protein